MPIICSMIIPLLLLTSPALPAPADLAAADSAFAAHDIAGAYAAYREVVASNADRRSKDLATDKAALIEWRYHGDFEAARSRLLAAVDGAEEPDLLLRELAELEIAAGNHDAARAAAQRAVLLASTGEDSRAARELFAAATIRQALAQRDTISGTLAGELRDAHAILRRMNETDPGLLPAARLLLTSSLLFDDGPAALAALHSYYRFTGDEAPYNNVAAAIHELIALLPSWKGAEESVERRTALIRALAGACFFAEAALVARDPRSPLPTDPEIGDIVAYADFINQVQEVTDAYYRDLSLGKKVSDAWLLRLPELLETLRAASSWGATLSPVPQKSIGNADSAVEAVIDAIGKRFHAYANLGTTAGYLDLHYSHAIANTTRAVSRNPEDGRVTLIELDLMVSNGFESWAWNYQMQHGGWANSKGIYDVRPAGTGGALKAWRSITDPLEQERLDKQLATLLKEDEERARTIATPNLPGLRLRLRLLSAERLRDELSARGLGGAELRTAFYEEYGKRQQETAIFAHEGRHVLDKRLGITDGAELEFRAKLSEVAASKTPLGTFAGQVMGANTGDATPHGQAQKRIIDALVAWMSVHAAEISGFENGKPVLPQLYRLSDAQLLEFIRGLDPANHPS